MGTNRVQICFVLLAVGLSTAQTPDRTVTTRSPHGKLAVACESCHTFSSWTPLRSLLDFDHGRTAYPLRGMHQAVGCRQCHTKLVFTSVSTRCADCHADIHRRQFGAECERCHSVKGWKVSLQEVQQHQNRFPLLGAHAVLECADCHKGAATGQFQGLPTDCAACHAANYQQATVPNHQAAGFSTACQTCHSMDGWPGANFDHQGVTGFALTGAHAGLDCSACHGTGNFQKAQADCATCHAQDYASTNNPNHAKAGIPATCAQCHTTANWAGARFDHTAFTQFALTGAHATVECAQCHANGQYAGTSTACASCHLKDYQKTTNPNHVSAGFPQDCSVCHSTTQWAGATFDHSKTQFALTGAHASQSCASCHTSGQYAGLSTACVSCHLGNYNNTKNPNHQAAGLPQTCDQCHTTMAWIPASLDHSRTQFPLTGAHVNVACSQCHVNGRYAGTPTDCAACHLANYNKTTNPNHVSAGFPQDCTLCHTTVQWAGATFDHSKTLFPLTGAHATQTCSSCHSSGQYVGLSTACSSCHLNNYNGATDPNHKAAGFSLTCSQCHNTMAWSGATYTHLSFQLTGAHTALSCSQCHASGVYAGTPKTCVSCHLNDFNKTTNPNHVAAGFPQDCSICHSTTQWAGAKFDHSQTQFPLTGAHVSLSCTSCHASGQYVGLSTACVSCHLTNYNSTTNPNHIAAGFPQQCNVCHTTMAWIPSIFNHSTTAFPLTGAHTTTPCASCHIGGRYAGTPTDCYSCHKTEYTSVTNPNHVAAGFPTDCSQCHTTTAWTGATFNHTWFPIYSGAHNGKWTTCNDCHTNSANFAVFSCLNCHAHDKAAMDSTHSGVRNYVYNSSNCYACHPTGRAG